MNVVIRPWIANKPLLEDWEVAARTVFQAAPIIEPLTSDRFGQLRQPLWNRNRGSRQFPNRPFPPVTGGDDPLSVRAELSPVNPPLGLERISQGEAAVSLPESQRALPPARNRPLPARPD